MFKAKRNIEYVKAGEVVEVVAIQGNTVWLRLIGGMTTVSVRTFKLNFTAI